MSNSAKRAFLWTLAAIWSLLGPFCVEATNIELDHSGNLNGALLIVTLVSGVAPLAFAPTTRLVRVLFGILYLLVMIPALFVFGAELVCGLYRSCM